MHRTLREIAAAYGAIGLAGGWAPRAPRAVPAPIAKPVASHQTRSAHGSSSMSTQQRARHEALLRNQQRREREELTKEASFAEAQLAEVQLAARVARLEHERNARQAQYGGGAPGLTAGSGSGAALSGSLSFAAQLLAAHSEPDQLGAITAATAAAPVRRAAAASAQRRAAPIAPAAPQPPIGTRPPAAAAAPRAAPAPAKKAWAAAPWASRAAAGSPRKTLAEIEREERETGGGSGASSTFFGSNPGPVSEGSADADDAMDAVGEGAEGEGAEEEEEESEVADGEKEEEGGDQE